MSADASSARREVEEGEQRVGVLLQRRDGLRVLGAVLGSEPRVIASRACARVSAYMISWSAAFTRGCSRFGSVSRMFPSLWNQSRCSRVFGHTSRTASQNPRAPSPKRLSTISAETCEAISARRLGEEDVGFAWPLGLASASGVAATGCRPAPCGPRRRSSSVSGRQRSPISNSQPACLLPHYNQVGVCCTQFNLAEGPAVRFGLAQDDAGHPVAPRRTAW